MSGMDKNGKAGAGGEFAEQVVKWGLPAAWNTPRAMDGEKQSGRSTARKEAGELPSNLHEQATIWAVPSQTNESSSSSMNDVLNLLRSLLSRAGSQETSSTSDNWPTPDAQTFQDGMICTPEEWAARRERLKAEAKTPNGNGCGTPLAMAASLWGTPNAHDGRPGVDEFSTQGANLNRDAANWSTPQARNAPDCKAERARNSPALESLAINWSTPTTRDHKDGTNPSKQVETNSLLGREAPRWGFPPSLHDQDSGSGSCLLTGAEFDCLLMEMRRHGARFLEYDPNSPRLSLNPIFVTWLMGWPMTALGI